MKNLKIYKASAGSGKTFRLAVEFIKTVLLKPADFKHILAITFTNKATNEMKSRILEVLYNLSQGKENEGYYEVLEKELPKKINIQKQATKALQLILNDFSYFNISTIDSFFQNLLRNFIRELNLRFNYTVELDTEQTKEEIYSQLIQQMAENIMLRKWITGMMYQNIENNNKWNLKSDILNITSEVFKEFFQQQKENISFTPGELLKKKKELDKYQDLKLTELLQHASDFNNLMVSYGLDYGDFYYGTKGVGGFFNKLSEIEFTKIIPELNSYSRKTLEEKKWFTKIPAGITDEVINQFDTIFHATMADIHKFGKILNGVIAVNKNFYEQGILTFIYSIFKDYAAENNLFFLPQTGLLISKIIGDNPQPIIYEKIGNYFNQMMIDEFQDTSDIQYQNFKPLINEIISSEENSALVVGDVKQSIYRWRNTNWNLLKESIQKDFKDYFTEENLQKNYRSAKTIVDFNNKFFEYLANLHDKTTGTTLFSDIYPTNPNDFQINTKKHQGFISVEGLPQLNFAEEATKKTIDFIKTLQDKGYQARDIALLVRKNDEATTLANALIKAQADSNAESQSYNFKFISNEALLLTTSPLVNLMIDVLRYLTVQENELLLTQIKKYWVELNYDENSQLPTLWLYDKNIHNSILEKINDCKSQRERSSLFELSRLIIDIFELDTYINQVAFLKCTMDKIFDFEIKNGNQPYQFIKWWEQNSQKFKVFFSEDQDAIQIYTIHKAKGLQFPIVILPFANWMIKAEKKLWVKSDIPPFNGKYFYVNNNNELQNTIFEKDARHEKLNTLVDNLNLLYVAFTRPETVLKVFFKTEANANFTSKWIQSFVEAFGEKNVFEKGILEAPLPKDNKTLVNSYKLAKPETIQKKYTMLISDRLASSPSRDSKQKQGEIIHSILQQVRTKTDIERVLRQQAFLSPENTEIIRNFFDTGFKNDLFADWFSEKWAVYNEYDLINDAGKIIRPDRLLIKDNQAIIIDFKTGEAHPHYHEQIEAYTTTIKQLGFETVNGYLIYLSPFKIEQVV